MKKLIFLLLSSLVILLSCSKQREEDIEIKKFSAESNEEDQLNSGNDTVKAGLTGEPSGLERIATKQVKTRIGDSLFVEGLVADIYMSDKVAYLNFDNKFPRNSIAGTIFASRFNEFGDLSKFKNKKVEMRGKITTYKNKPQIILQSKDQVRILD